MLIDKRETKRTPSVRRALEFGHLPRRGYCPPAQGCCTRLPWERRGEFPNPNRGCGRASRRKRMY